MIVTVWIALGLAFVAVIAGTVALAVWGEDDRPSAPVRGGSLAPQGYKQSAQRGHGAE